MSSPAPAQSSDRIRPRRVSFDYADTPTHWIPNDPHTTHVINVLHLLLPAGERWFCEVYRRALAHIDDPDLARDVKAFIGQEATHARAHDVVLDDLSERGIDHRAFTSVVEWVTNAVRVRSAPDVVPDSLKGLVERRYLLHQLAAIAAVEHYTSVLGWWILTGSDELDRAGADAEMMALLRWHGAEEVEHRSVAFDAYKAVGGGYLMRSAYMLGLSVAFWPVWFAGVDHLIRSDRTVSKPRRVNLKEFLRATRQGRLPSVGSIFAATPRYLRFDFHPSQEGDTEVAKRYLAEARGVKPTAA